jgi:hypothetical protein
MGISQFRLNVGTALQALAVAMVLLFSAANAHADYLSLQTVNSSGSIGVAQFLQGERNAGTGLFNTFVEVGGNDPVVVAYNTTENNTLNNGSPDNFNHAITVNDALAEINGQLYVRFFLDINEANPPGSGGGFLSLDELKIITSTTPNQSVQGVPAGTVRYDMGAGNGVLLFYDLEPGSGFSDMTLLVPLWDGADTSQFLYLYSKFGVVGTGSVTCNSLTPPDLGPVIGGDGGCTGTSRNYGNSDGFEEWAYQTSTVVIPEPSTYALYALGATMLFVSGWWQKRRRALPSPRA